MTYDALRQFADSWGLVAMVAFFVAVAVFVFRPGSKRKYDEAAKIPFENDPKD
jgi:cytochrome c oxidase cbb3-type subunit 4